MSRTTRDHLIGFLYGLAVTVGVAVFAYLSSVGSAEEIALSGLAITLARSVGSYLSDYASRHQE